jgi:hypothetical protein
MDMTWEDFVAQATATDVTFTKDDPSFRALTNRLVGKHGVYCFQLGDTVLRIGESHSDAGLQQRLTHHMDAALGKMKSDFPNHWVFHRELYGRALTIRTLICDAADSKEREKDVQAAVPGGGKRAILWEALQPLARQVNALWKSDGPGAATTQAAIAEFRDAIRRRLGEA